MASIPEQLKELVGMLEQGYITREQFERQRDALLGEATHESTPHPTPSPATSRPLLAATGDLIGQRILEYRLERKLGEGGMGTVFLAVHETLGQRVAIKILDPPLARSPEVRERFLQEARIQIGLRHPGIVQALTANTEGQHLALVMEYIEGLSLAEVIERRGALPLDEASHLFTQVLSAVGYAHSQSVVHRDIKPSNVMVEADGTAMVTDFGIAKVAGASKLTRTGTVMGSAHYMSPEQVLGQKDIDYRTDIYSLGIAFYEVLTGHTPFEGQVESATDSDYMIKDAHVRRPPPDPRVFRSDVPPYMTQALFIALAKEPAERFDSCEAFRKKLEGPVHQARPAEQLVRRRNPSNKAAAQEPGSDSGHSPDPVKIPQERVSASPENSETKPAKFVTIKPGAFTMGASSEPGTQHGPVDANQRVHLTQSFQISLTAVTQEQWMATMGNNPSHFKGDSLPVECVNWFDAVAFCNKLSEREGLNQAYRIEGETVTWQLRADGYRLPTEAEWECAARAGEQHVTSGSGAPVLVAWYAANSSITTHPVATKRSNAWGLYDMSGNVSEWVWDWYAEYSGQDLSNPTGPPMGVERVHRGGSWYSPLASLGCTHRNSENPHDCSRDRGFRIARSVVSGAAALHVGD